MNINTGSPIALETASEWTKKFRTENPGALRAHGFGSNILQTILSQPDCIGIRFYNAINDSGANTLVIVGVNSANDDMVHGVVADFSLPCPLDCSANSPLADT